MTKLHSPRKGAFSLAKFWSVMNNPKAIENALRSRGIITEGYNPTRDVYERVYKVGPFVKVSTVHSFTGSTKTAIFAKPSTSFEVFRPGVRMIFKSPVDFQRRMHKLLDHPGFNLARGAPFTVINRSTGIHSFISEERIVTSAKVNTLEAGRFNKPPVSGRRKPIRRDNAAIKAHQAVAA